MRGIRGYPSSTDVLGMVSRASLELFFGDEHRNGS